MPRDHALERTLDLSVSYIPTQVRQCLWGKAGGRCQYAGCNHPLYRDDVTNAEFNTSYIAHIVADKPSGPRGDAVLSEQLKSDIGNLMLMCDTHHRLIDIVDVTGHSVELLTRMKMDHEARIELLTGIQEEKQSHILMYGAKVGEHDSPLAYSKVSLAMVPDRYPATAQALSIGLKNSSYTDAELAYWEIEREHLRRQVDRFVRPAISSGEITHLSIFGFAPIPLLVAFGAEISDIPAADIYQLHREPPTWKWLDDPDAFAFTVSTDGNLAVSTVALILSLSADIRFERVFDALGNDVAIWHITHATPHNDFLQGRGQLRRFREVLRRTFNDIKMQHGENARLHVFPAVPVSCAIELGRVWMPKADLPFVLYDQNRKTGGFTPTITIQQPE